MPLPRLHPLVGILSAAMLAVALLPLLPTASRADQTVIHLSLSHYKGVVHGEHGDSVGVSPQRAVVHVGDRVIFINDDSDRHHTATSIAGAAGFPADPRWTDESLGAGGSIGGEHFSTGDLAPGARATLSAKKAGTYYFGCFYDYSAGMRGVIVVEP